MSKATARRQRNCALDGDELEQELIGPAGDVDLDQVLHRECIFAATTVRSCLESAGLKMLMGYWASSVTRMPAKREVTV